MPARLATSLAFILTGLLVGLGSARTPAAQSAEQPAEQAAPAAQPKPPPTDGPAKPLVVVAEIDGIIHPIAAEFMDEVIERADADRAAAVVFVLRTPGGLLDSTRTIVSRMLEARTPVVMFVGPSGARAASAGFILVVAADVAAMAPGTHIGAAHPVSGTGDQKLSETVEKKAAEDVAAYARTIAAQRGRNVPLAAAAVTESKAFTEREAIDAEPPLIDLVVNDLDELVKQLDGRTVKRFDGSEVTLATAGAEVERMEMTRRQRFLSFIAHPQIAYILLSLGVLGLTVELWSPGAIVPGVVGGVSLLLAFFAFQILPVNTAGILLIVLGVGLLVLELTVPSFGALGVGGAISLLVGSIMITREVPGVEVGLPSIVGVVSAIVIIVLGLGRLAMKSIQRPAVSGMDGLIGSAGRTLTAIAPGETAQIALHGEIWRAVSDVPVPAGAPVRVVAVDGLTLHVQPDPTSKGGPS